MIALFFACTSTKKNDHRLTRLPADATPRVLRSESTQVLIRIVDVGAGLCCIIRLPENKYVIYDAGDHSLANSRIAELIPPGSAIEMLVLSHSDADHLGSTKFICENYKVKSILHGGLAKDTDKWRDAMRAIATEVRVDRCQEYNFKFNPLPPGTYFDLGSTRLTIVYGLHAPPAEWSLDGGPYYNAGSIVIRLDFGTSSDLLCGDTVGRDANDPDQESCKYSELEMVRNANRVLLNADVIIAPHHGADNGSSLPFIRAVSPQWVVFSSGSKFGHPWTVAANRFLRAGVPIHRILRTDRDDNEGNPKEWLPTPGATKDKPLDDDVNIYLPRSGDPIVRYAQ